MVPGLIAEVGQELVHRDALVVVRGDGLHDSAEGRAAAREPRVRNRREDRGRADEALPLRVEVCEQCGGHGDVRGAQRRRGRGPATTGQRVAHGCCKTR